MKAQLTIMSALLLCGLMVTAGRAQVVSLGEVPTHSRVVPVSCDRGGLWRGYGPGCGAAGSTCGAAGIGSMSCSSCGVGGYFGRNIHPVDPCACGGSLIADLAFGVKTVVDRTVTCVFSRVFCGLRSVGCHASDSLAALRCTAATYCASCSGPCGGTCGAAGYVDDWDDGTVGTIESGQYLPTPAQAPVAAPLKPALMDDSATNPFTDDPPEQSVPQTRRMPRPTPARLLHNKPRYQVQPAMYRQPVVGTGVQRVLKSTMSTASVVKRNARSRHLGSRSVTIRR